MKLSIILFIFFYIFKPQYHHSLVNELNDLLNRYPNLVGFCRSCNPYYSYTWLKSIKNTIQAAETDNRSLAELNIGEVQNLENIANLGEDAGLARLQARSILNFFYGYSYEDEPKLPTTAPALRTMPTDTTENAIATENTLTSPQMQLSPNPTTNWVKVQYALAAEAMDAQFWVTDVQGKMLHQQNIAADSGQFTYDCVHLPVGVYFAVLKCRGQSPLVKKIIIIR